MSNKIIRKGFESILATWANSKTPKIPVAWQNQAFTPPVGRYVRVALLPGQTTSADLDGLQRTFVGVFQVSLCVALGTGSAEAQALEDEIIALYPKSTEIALDGGLMMRLTRPMSASPPLPDNTHHVIPISCSYQLLN